METNFLETNLHAQIFSNILYPKQSPDVLPGQAVNNVSHHVSQLSAVLLYKWANNFKIQTEQLSIS